MKNIYINNIGNGGLISDNDVPSFEINPDAINDGINFRFRDGMLVRMSGYKNIPFDYGTVFADYNFYMGTMLKSAQLEGMIFLMYKQIGAVEDFSYPDRKASRGFGTPAPRIVANIKLAYWSGQGRELVDVTPVPTPANWDYLNEPQLFSYLGMVYYNNQSTKPFTLTPWDAPIPGENIPRFKEMTLFPINYTAKVLVAFQNHIVAVGGKYSTGLAFENPYEVRWSDVIKDIGEQPEWDIKPENEAGSTIIPDVYSGSFAAVQMGNNLLIYTLSCTFRLYPVGLPNVYGLEMVFPNIGCISNNCVAEFSGNHIIATDNNVYVHNGSTIKSIADGRVAKWLTVKTQNFNSVGIFHNVVAREMYLYFSNQIDNIYADIMLMYNYITDQWSLAECPQASFLISGIAYDDLVSWDQMTNYTYGGLLSITKDYDTLRRQSARRSFYYVKHFPDPVDPKITRSSIELDDPNLFIRRPTVENPVLYTTYFRRNYLDLKSLDDGQKDQDLQKYVYEMLIYMRGTGDLQVEVWTSMNTNGPDKKIIDTLMTYTATESYDELSTFKIDLRGTSRYISYKISKADSGIMDIKSIQFKYRLRGLR